MLLLRFVAVDYVSKEFLHAIWIKHLLYKKGGMKGIKTQGPDKGLDNTVPVWISVMA